MNKYASVKVSSHLGQESDASLQQSIRRGILLMSLPPALAMSSFALAQTTETIPQRRSAALEEIVVSASRRTESIQDVATSVSVMSASDLEAQGITSFKEMAQSMAGLHLEQDGDINSAQIRIRGVGASPRSGGIDHAVGVLIDGMYIPAPGSAFGELLDIERVEVLRGPQGTMFGKNTTAGVVHIHTQKPNTQEFSGRLQGVLGNYDSRELRGLVNIPLIENKLAVRLSAHTAERDGHSRNIFTGRDTQNEDRKGMRAKLLWHATENLDVELSSDVINQKGRFDRRLIDYSGRYNGRPWAAIAADLGRPLPDTERGRTAHNETTYENDIERHVATLTWSLANHTLQSITGYEETEAQLYQDNDFSPFDLAIVTNDGSRRTRSQEFLFSSDSSASLSYVVGLFYQKETLDSPSVVTSGADAVTLGMARPQTLSNTYRDGETRAIFGNVSYDLNDRWTVVGGLRYTSEKKHHQSIMDVGSGPFSAMDSKKTFNEWTYTAKLKHHVNDATMLYLSFDRGFKAGGFNRQDVQCVLGIAPNRCIPDDELNYDTETTNNIEVGIKSEWLDSRIRLNAAVFHQTFDNYQVTQLIPDQALPVIRNAAEVESTGLEADVVAVLTDRLRLNSSLAWIRAKYDSFADAPCAYAGAPGCESGRQDLSGKQLDYAPKFTGNLGLEYRAPLLDHPVEWIARVDASYRSAVNLNILQTESTRQGGYVLYSARVGLESLDGQWGITLWGRNLSDKDYAIVSEETMEGLKAVQGLPRTYGVTLDWRF